jgi:hypothetical protein
MFHRITSVGFSCFFVLISASTAAIAQNVDGSSREGLQEVVVTGSRIPTDPNLVASTPHSIFG